MVIIESPYTAPRPRDLVKNQRYLQACILDSIERGEAPVASHQLYTQALNDRMPNARELGMSCGWSLMLYAEYVAVYTDLGISLGMAKGIEAAARAGRRVEYRKLPSSF